MGRRTATATVLLALLLHALVLSGQAGAAEAADGYRYWSFWQQKEGKSGQEQWGYATQGPAVLRPADGDVLGFRFAVSADSKDAKTPRGTADFGALCGDTRAKPDGKRVGISLDFGTPADAPRGEKPPQRRTACAAVPKDATAAEALAAVAKPLRYNSDALLCAVHGYPARGCGEQTGSGDDSTAADDSGKGGKDETGAKDDGSGGLPAGVGIGGGVLVIAALGGAAVWQARRRRG